MLGERTAEEIKMTLGSAFPLPSEREAEIRGRDLVSGLPRTVTVSSAEVRQALEEPLHAIVDAVRSHPRPDPARAGRRHHGPRHRAHRRRRPAARPRRAAPPRDRHAGARRGEPAHLGGHGRRPCVEEFEALQQVLVARPTEVGVTRHPGRVPRRQRPRARSCSRWCSACVTLITLDHPAATDSPGRAGPPRRRRGVRPGRGGHGRRWSARSRRCPPGSAPATRCSSDRRPARGRELRAAGQVATAGFDRNRLEEYDGLTAAAQQTGHALVPGPRDRARPHAVLLAHRHHRRRLRAPGSSPDLTVVNDDGLVGRVLRVTRTTATVLLDRRRRLGRGRPGRRAAWRSASSRGRGVLGDEGRLDLELVDDVGGARPGATWSSPGAARAVRRTSPGCRSAR